MLTASYLDMTDRYGGVLGGRGDLLPNPAVDPPGPVTGTVLRRYQAVSVTGLAFCRPCAFLVSLVMPYLRQSKSPACSFCRRNPPRSDLPSTRPGPAHNPSPLSNPCSFLLSRPWFLTLSHHHSPRPSPLLLSPSIPTSLVSFTRNCFGVSSRVCANLHTNAPIARLLDPSTGFHQRRPALIFSRLLIDC